MRDKMGASPAAEATANLLLFSRIPRISRPSGQRMNEAGQFPLFNSCMDVYEHQLDDDGEHWPDECEVCFERNNATNCHHKCGCCCESLLIEVSLRDAEREPRIKWCRAIYDDMSGERELIGYLINDQSQDMACRFFNRNARACSIYETRPLVCRVYDCEDDAER